MLFSSPKPILCLLTLLTTLASSEMIEGITQIPNIQNSTTAFVKYSNADTNSDLSSSPRVYISFDGSNTRIPFIMDTGSVGIVASPDFFQHANDAQNLGSGTQTYSSSGIIENGTWWSATQNIYDANGTLIATSNVPVLEVTSITCTQNARMCQATNNPTGVSVMGIGFGRESPEQLRGTPGYNPFLNLQSVLQNGVLQPLPSNWCNGYVVTPTGVYLGLTATNTVNAGWAQLELWAQYSTPSLSEWMPATMTINANGVSGNGNVLMDTGVGTSYLTPPPGSSLGTPVQCPDNPTLVECAPDGDSFGIYLPNQTNPVAFYSFTVGQNGNLMNPDGVHIDNTSDTFFNTSRHVLGGINFIYDNTDGYIGYIWNGMSGSNVGYVIPTATISGTTLTTSQNSVPFGKNVVFTSIVEGGNPSVIPTGTVTFFIDNVAQNPIALRNGNAVFSISTLPPVMHTIHAVYSGDSQYGSSTSNVVQQYIDPPTCF